MSQRVSDLVSRRIDPSTLKDWIERDDSETSSKMTLMEAYQKCSFDEYAHNWFREEVTGDKNVPLCTNTFSDTRQTLMHIARSATSPSNCTIFLVEDAEKTYSITFRLVGVHAVNNETPLLSILYSHGPGPGIDRAADFLMNRSDLVPRIIATVLEQKFLLRILEQNSKRITPSFKPLRHYSERAYKLSFILPLRPLTAENIGSLTKSGCARCGVPALSRCSACQSVAYCGKECQTADWKQHKRICKPLSKGFWIRVRFSTAQEEEGLVGTVGVMNKHSMPEDVMKHLFNTTDGPPKNVHGSTPFIVKIQVPVNGAEEEDDSDMMVYDRRRSFTGFILRKTDPDAYARLEALVRMKGIWGLKIYRWAKMVGDWTLEICMDVEPNEPTQW